MAIIFDFVWSNNYLQQVDSCMQPALYTLYCITVLCISICVYKTIY